MTIDFKTTFQDFIENSPLCQEIKTDFYRSETWTSASEKTKKNYGMAIEAILELIVIDPEMVVTGRGNPLNKMLHKNQSEVVLKFYKPLNSKTKIPDAEVVFSWITQWFVHNPTVSQSDLRSKVEKETFEWKVKVLENGTDYTKNIDFNTTHKGFLESSPTYRDLMKDEKFAHYRQAELPKKYTRFCIELLLLNPNIFLDSNFMGDKSLLNVRNENSEAMRNFMSEQAENNPALGMYRDGAMITLCSSLGNSVSTYYYRNYWYGESEKPILEKFCDELVQWGKDHNLKPKRKTTI